MRFWWWDDAVVEAVGRFTTTGIKYRVKRAVTKYGGPCWQLEALVEVCS